MQVGPSFSPNRVMFIQQNHSPGEGPVTYGLDAADLKIRPSALRRSERQGLCLQIVEHAHVLLHHVPRCRSWSPHSRSRRVEGTGVPSDPVVVDVVAPRVEVRALEVEHHPRDRHLHATARASGLAAPGSTRRRRGCFCRSRMPESAAPERLHHLRDHRPREQRVRRAGVHDHAARPVRLQRERRLRDPQPPHADRQAGEADVVEG
jgi:hypothetical protein